MSSPSFAQSNTSTSDLTLPPRADNSSAVLAEYRSQVNNVSEDLKKVGRGGNITPIMNILKNAKAFGSAKGNSSTGLSAEENRDLLILQAAQILVINGKSPNQINELKKAGYDPVLGIERTLTEGVTLTDAIALTQFPTLGRIASVAPSNSGALITIEVLDTFGKFNKLSGQKTFEVFDYEPAATVGVGTECLFFLSKARADFRKANNYVLSGGELSEHYSPYCNIDGKFKATDTNYSPLSVTKVELLLATMVLDK